MDERIREILGAIEKWTCGKREDKPLNHLRPNSGMGEGEETEKQTGGFKKKKKRVLERETAPSL